MTTDEMIETWERHHATEFLKFERVEEKRHRRPDVHAFILLDELCPDDSDMVTAAEHDEIWLAVNFEDVAPAITEEQVIELIRCGVRLDTSVDCFAMFV